MSHEPYKLLSLGEKDQETRGRGVEGGDNNPKTRAGRDDQDVAEM